MTSQPTPSSTESQIPRPPVSAARAARRHRIRSIRRTVVAGAVSLFMAGWLLIAGVLVSGHDPALAQSASASSTSGGTTTSQTTGSTAPLTTATSGAASATTGTASTAATGSAATSGTSGSGLSSVVTRQS